MLLLPTLQWISMQANTNTPELKIKKKKRDRRHAKLRWLNSGPHKTFRSYFPMLNLLNSGWWDNPKGSCSPARVYLYLLIIKECQKPPIVHQKCEKRCKFTWTKCAKRWRNSMAFAKLQCDLLHSVLLLKLQGSVRRRLRCSEKQPAYLMYNFAECFLQFTMNGG